MSNIEFLLVMFLSNSIFLILIILRSIRKKSPRSLLKFFFLPVLLCSLVGVLVQSFTEISEVSNRQVLGNLLLLTWCLKSFNSYKSMKVILLDEFLSSVRSLISDKKFFRLLILILKISLLQIICFSSVLSLNYLSGYSALVMMDLIGLVLCFAGLTLELLSEKEIKENLSKGKKIIKSGPWAYVRHPNLTGILLFFGGLQLLSFNAVGSQWSIIGFFLLLYIVISLLIPEIENKLLLKYPKYKSHIDSLPILLKITNK